MHFDVLRGFTVERQILEEGEPPLGVEAVAIGEHLWYQISSEGETTCYIHATVDQLPGIATVSHTPAEGGPAVATTATHTAVPARRPYPHATVTLVSRVRGDRIEPGPVPGIYAGSARLVDVAGLLSGQAVQRLALDPRSKIRVPAEIRTSEGRLTGVRVVGRDFVAGLEEAGVDDPRWTEAGGVMQFLVSFSEPGRSVILSPPPAPETVELVGPDFEGRLADCKRKHR